MSEKREQSGCIFQQKENATAFVEDIKERAKI